MNHPSREAVFVLRTDSGNRGTPNAVIIERKMYRLTELDDEGMAEMFNGGNRLPLVPDAINKHLCDAKP